MYSIYCSTLANKGEGWSFAKPSNVVLTKTMMTSVLKNINRNLRKLFYWQWHIGFVNKPISSFLTEPQQVLDVTWMPAPSRTRFHADPFAIWRDGKLHLFYEEFDFLSQKGWLVTRYWNGKKFSEPQTLMKDAWHYSYPFLLQNGEDLFCIPETNEIGAADLWKCEEFPLKWKKISTLVSGRSLVDSTIFYHDNTWWLLASDNDDDVNSKLFIWYADDLTGPWKPHPQAPAKVDITSSRPAGSVFLHDGQLYRPAQDCARIYGGRVVLNRIVTLNKNEFKEETCSLVEAKAPFDAFHTLSACGNITFIDCAKKRFLLATPELFFKRIASFFRRRICAY